MMLRNRFLIICSLLVWGFLAVHAQERQHSWMVGGGSANILDTYLSPYAYQGTDLRFLRETQRRVSRPNLLGGDAPTFQTLLDVDMGIVESPAKNVDEYTVGVRYSMAWLHPIPLNLRCLSLQAGPMASGYLGGIYNERNGNNPGQAKADIALELTLQAGTDFRLPRWMRIVREPLHARCQLMVPVAGLAFSPNFGQSYYEMFELDDYDHNIVFATPFNAPSARWQLTLDVPLHAERSATCLRLGYGGTVMQSTFNHLRYHSYTHTFMIGVTKSFRKL